MPQDTKIRNLMDLHVDGSLTRRQFVTRLLAAGVSLTAIPAIVAACSTTGASAAPSSAAASATPGASAAASAAAASAAPSASAVTGKSYNLFMTPKWTGFPYFELAAKGGKDAATDLGDKFTYAGADHSDPLLQVQTIQNFLQQSPDAIILASIDQTTDLPVLTQALQKGVKVVTFDADTGADARNVFCNQLTYEQAAKLILDTCLVDDPSGGPVAFVAATPTTANHKAHIDNMKRLIQTDPKYQVFKALETVYANDDDAKSYDVAVNLMQAHPDLKFIASSSAVSCPAAARAIEATGHVGKVYSGGFALPSAIKKYLVDGSQKAFGLWDPYELGYMATYVAHLLLTGELKLASGSLHPTSGTQFTAGKVGQYTVGDNGESVYGKGLIFTKDNIDKYTF